jgi:hypothetical protein
LTLRSCGFEFRLSHQIIVLKVYPKLEHRLIYLSKGKQMSNSQDFSKVSGQIVYCQMQEPVKAYVKAGNPPKPDEYKCSVVLVDEDYVDDLEAYAKSLDTLLSLKKVKTAEFEGIYKVAPPEGASKNVWVLTLRKSTELGKSGKPLPTQHKPKVFMMKGNTRLDVTNELLVANGSYGTISIDRFDRSSGGSSLYLKNLMVTDLIEYVKQESDYESGSEFDDEAPAPAKEKPKAAPAAKPAAKKAPKPVDDEDDSDVPF